VYPSVPVPKHKYVRAEKYVANEEVKLHAESEFEKYRIVQDGLYISDYDRYLAELEAWEEGIKDG